MAVGTVRSFRYRMPHPGDGEPLPEAGDFFVSSSSKPEAQWATYRVERARVTRDEVEPWCNGGHPDDRIAEGAMLRVVHLRVVAVRVEPSERPADAMTWYSRADRRNHRH